MSTGRQGFDSKRGLRHRCGSAGSTPVSEALSGPRSPCRRPTGPGSGRCVPGDGRPLRRVAESLRVDMRPEGSTSPEPPDPTLGGCADTRRCFPRVHLATSHCVSVAAGVRPGRVSRIVPQEIAGSPRGGSAESGVRRTTGRTADRRSESLPRNAPRRNRTRGWPGTLRLAPSCLPWVRPSPTPMIRAGHGGRVVWKLNSETKDWPNSCSRRFPTG